MKVSYIPDFGYSEQLNFSIDSQVNNVEGRVSGSLFREMEDVGQLDLDAIRA